MRTARVAAVGHILALALTGAPATAQTMGASIEEPGVGSAPLVLRGGWLFDVASGTMIRNTGLVVRAGKIMRIGAEPAERDGLTDARVVELDDDEYVLPGLFDLHAHYAIDLFGEGRVDETVAYPVLFLANGVTSTFPAGEVTPYAMEELRRAIDRGERVGPRIYNSGPYFGSARYGWDPEISAEQICREVDYWAERGVRGFKAKGIAPEHLRPLIACTHRHGLTVTGHLGSGFRNSVNPRDAILMGIDRVEHFLGGDAIRGDRPAYASLESLDPRTPEFDRIVQLFLKHGVYFDATLTAYGYFGEREPAVFEYWEDEQKYFTPYMREVLAGRPRRPVNEQFERIYRVKRKTIKAFYDAGGGRLITLGTDHPSWGEYLSAFAAHRELHAFVLAGIPPADALRFATINAAHALGVSDRLGTIEPGKLADLFVVKGNPLDDIRNTRNVHWVVKAGRLYDARELLRSVEGTIGPKSPDEIDRWKGRPVPPISLAARREPTQ